MTVFGCTRILEVSKLSSAILADGGDHANSHDVEDLLTVIDGREAIVGEIAAANADLRSYIAEQFRVLLKTAAFHDALPGYLLPDPGSQARLPLLLERIKGIADDGP
jgi:hypothetical protein